MTYDTLAEVYEWLMPEELVDPRGSVAAFAPFVRELEPGARLLDCAVGPGHLAVGLALAGFSVAGSDISAGMVEAARERAREHGVSLDLAVRSWEDLRDWGERFDAVFCVGNSLTHAPGREGRRRALRGMADALRPGGLLAITAYNYDLVRRRPPSRRVIERVHGSAEVVYEFDFPNDRDAEHHLDITIETAGRTHRQRLAFWPFTPPELDADLRSAGLVAKSSTYSPEVERYLVTARLSP